MAREGETRLAVLRVRYKNGDTDEWTLSDRTDLHQLARTLHAALVGTMAVSFGVAPKEGTEPLDFGFVGLQMPEVVMWEIDGFLDEAATLALETMFQQPEGPNTDQ